MNFKEKYIKYKIKYLNLQNELNNKNLISVGGADNDNINGSNIIDFNY